MRRYYFHLRKNGCLLEDLRGGDFSNLQEAYDAALETMRKMALDLNKDSASINGRSIEICNQNGNVLLAVPFTKIHAA
jgi:hypothetical protein